MKKNFFKIQLKLKNNLGAVEYVSCSFAEG